MSVFIKVRDDKNRTWLVNANQVVALRALPVTAKPEDDRVQIITTREGGDLIVRETLSEILMQIPAPSGE